MNETKYQNLFVENVINGEIHDEEILNLIVPIGKITPEKVMAIYAEDYQYRMLESMQSNFESVWLILGDELFKEIVFDFIIEYPSTVYDLNQLGNSFPSYLRSYKNLINQIPLIEELAQFEITHWTLFHSPINKQSKLSKPLDKELFNSYLEFNQNIVLVSSRFKVFEIFKNRKNDSDFFFQNYDLKFLEEQSYYLLYKNGLQVNCFPLSTAQFLFFKELEKKKSIIDVINLEIDITQEEILEMFKLISSSLLTFLKEK